MPFSVQINLTITFYDNEYNKFRNWYPLQICDYADNLLNYKNEYLFDVPGTIKGTGLIVNNLNIENYIINNNTNYPISRTIDAEHSTWFCIHRGTFIKISSVTTDPLFYSDALAPPLRIVCLVIFQLKYYFIMMLSFFCSSSSEYHMSRVHRIRVHMNIYRIAGVS